MCVIRLGFEPWQLPWMSLLLCYFSFPLHSVLIKDACTQMFMTIFLSLFNWSCKLPQMRAVSSELEVLGRQQHPNLTIPFLKVVWICFLISKFCFLLHHSFWLDKEAYRLIWWLILDHISAIIHKLIMCMFGECWIFSTSHYLYGQRRQT